MLQFHQTATQRQTGAKQAALDRSDRDRKHLRDLLIIQLVDIAQDDHGPVIGFQLRQRPLEHGGSLLLFDAVVGRWFPAIGQLFGQSSGGSVVRGWGVEARGVSDPPFTKVGDGEVHGDAGHPGCHGALALETVDILDDLKHGLLGELQGVIAVADHA